MEARLGQFNTMADGTAVPSGNGVGTLMSTVPGRNAREWLTRITFVATGAFSCNVTVWMRDASGNWGPLGQLSGDVNGGDAFAEAGAGTYVYFISGERFGLPAELYYQASDMTNVTSLTVANAPVMEG